MNVYCTKETCQNICAALLRWRNDFQSEDYRQERLKLWQQLGPFKRSEISLRYVTDRVVSVAEGLDLWLLDLWLFIAVDAAALSHALWGFVVPAGLDELPLPQGRGPLHWLELREEERGGQAALCLGDVKALAQLTVLQFIAPYRLSRHDKALLPFLLSEDRSKVCPQAIATINIWMSDRDLLAQLLLLSVRQGSDDGSCWEALQGMLGGDSERDQELSFAYDHYLMPYGSLLGYLQKLHTWFSRGRQVPLDVLKEATRFGVCWNTIYQWQKEGLSEEEKKCRAAALQKSRDDADTARDLAKEWGVSYDAARMRIARMRKRPPCPVCGKRVIAPGRKRYCSDDCSQEARRRKRLAKAQDRELETEDIPRPKGPPLHMLERWAMPDEIRVNGKIICIN